MTAYRVCLRSSSTLKLGVERTFRTPSSATHVSDWSQIGDQDERTHRGLKYTCTLEAPALADAMGFAAVETARINDELALVHSTAIQDPQVSFAFNWDENVPDREFAQVIRNVPEIRRLRRRLNEEVFRPYYERRDLYRREFPRASRRIDRALRYLRNSSLESDPVDQFEDLWVGLESVNPLIQEKHDLATVYERKCATCSEPLLCGRCEARVRAPDNAAGIDYIITDLLHLSREKARALRSTRIDIAHSRRPLEDVLPRLPSMTALARRALTTGILDLLGLDERDRAPFLRTPLPLSDQPHFLIYGVLPGLGVQELEQMPRYPQLRVEGIEVLVPTDRGDETAPFDVLGVQLLVSMDNYNGPWNHVAIHHDIARDPDDESRAPDVIIRQIKRF